MPVFNSCDKTPLMALVNAAASFSQRMRRRHELWVLTCYFRPSALDALISSLSDQIKLTNVFLAYNYAEDFRDRDLAEALKKLVSRLRRVGINVEYRRIQSGSGLFHPKGYAIVQLDGMKGTIRDSYLLVTSGNLSDQGLGTGSANPNFELSYGSKLKKDARDFIAGVKAIWDSEAFKPSQVTQSKLSDYNLQLGILVDATYLCKWEGSLKQELSAIFKVTDESVELFSAGDPRLKELGFDVVRQSLTKYYFGDRPSKPLPKYFLKNYTAETLLGHWCPSTVWKVVLETFREDFEEFEEWLDSVTSESALRRVGEQCTNDLAGLKKLDIEIKGDPVESLRKRIKVLKENVVRKQRLYHQYEAFSLPYGLDDPDGLNALFESLKDTIGSKGRRNLVLRKVELAIRDRRLESLTLTEKELAHLRRELKPA